MYSTTGNSTPGTRGHCPGTSVKVETSDSSPSLLPRQQSSSVTPQRMLPQQQSESVTPRRLCCRNSSVRM